MIRMLRSVLVLLAATGTWCALALAVAEGQPAPEGVIIREIREKGPGRRFYIAEIQPEAGGPVGDMTVSQSTPGLLMVHPGSTVHMINGRAVLPSGDGSILRFIGKVSFTEGLFGGFTFEGEGAEPLGFVFIKEVGFVYLTGKGRVIVKDGSAVDLPLAQ